MKDLSAYYEIARLITAELSETITPEEKERLNVWLAEDERHYMRYCRIRERLKRGEGENVFRNPERVREDMEKLKKKLSGNKRRFLLSGNYFWRYAAVAVFTIGIAIGLIERPWEDRSSEMSPMAQQPAVLPGSYKAVLTLASGEQVNLEEWCRDSLWKDGTLIRKRKGELTYEQKAGDMQQEEMLFNTITIPRSGEYKLVLSDGTKVWLNSRSTLTFPGSFKGDIRNVKLDGEGYFAVTKNVEQPFIVETNKCNVKVLGTEFNVMAYAADSVWETSLLEGAVEILVPGSNNSGMRLEPNTMASLKGNRLVKGRIKEADYFLWREGLLCFNDISVRDMIEKLKLYYGVDIVVNNTRILKNRYTGKFRTKDGVEHVLKVLRLNNKFTYTKDDETNVITIN